MKVWNMETTDVIRFVLRRSEWEALITAIAGAAAWASDKDAQWDALEVLRSAEVDVDASAMVKALTHIEKYATNCRKPDNNDMEIIRVTAETGLRPQADKKAEAA